MDLEGETRDCGMSRETEMEKETAMRSNYPKRKRPVHPPPVEKHNAPIVLMITVCTNNHRDILADPDVHRALNAVWQEAGHWHVGHYTIMPDHVHFFCVPGIRPRVGIKTWIKYWKSQFTRTGIFDHNIWQADGWDTQMRDRNHYEEKLHYIRMNPVRKELVSSPEDWPYQGVVYPFFWK